MTLDIVVPLYNEERVVDSFHQNAVRVTTPLGFDVTRYSVSDGSTDATATILAKIAGVDGRVVVIGLGRSFGHQTALSAGLDKGRALRGVRASARLRASRN
jgi:dolichol-phosphate mannosyltransferase